MNSNSRMYRRKLLIPVAMCAVAASGCYTSGRIPANAAFSVMTYNVFVDRADPAAARRIIEESASDIVFLQEVTSQWEPTFAALRKKYPYQQHCAGARPICNALLSRFPLSKPKHLVTRHGWHDAWYAIARTPVGDVQLLGVHLSPPLTPDRRFTLDSLLRTGAVHKQEITRFGSAVDFTAPLIIFGDFNEDERGAAAAWVQEQGLQSALKRYDVLTPTWAWADLPLLTGRLDHIFHSPHLLPRHARVAWGGASDHRPVIAAFDAKSVSAGRLASTAAGNR